MHLKYYNSILLFCRPYRTFNANATLNPGLTSGATILASFCGTIHIESLRDCWRHFSPSPFGEGARG
jgi:hypothetical protein